jgi:4-diphosphocytidyl-2-C-methyl-D-erythritol kinase
VYALVPPVLLPNAHQFRGHVAGPTKTDAIVITCPAKINLTLEVLGRRESGFHALRSVMVPLGLADEMSLEPAGAFAFSCSDPSLENDDNLVVRAARALGKDGAPPGIRLALRKRVPSQAGLGGGSSDAAGVLLAAMDGALGEQPPRDWMAVARDLGSDVPFFLARTGALVEGTGERVTAAGSIPDWHVAVVKPPVAVSTAAAFAALDRSSRPSRPRDSSVSLRALVALQREDFDAVLASLHNDFQAVIAAEHPEVATALAALERAGASRALLSGSGSAVFALARDAAGVESVLARLDLDPGYARFATQFAPTPAWNTQTAPAR